MLSLITQCHHHQLSACPNPKFCCVIERYCKLFYTTPGYTEDAWHYIPTVINSVKVAPRLTPAHYRTEVCQQIQTMLDEGIIRHSKSPWMAPAVFVPKKSGQVRICIDYRINARLKIPTPYLCLMRYKTGLQGQQYSQQLFSTVGIGSCLFILQTGKRLLFAWGLVWGSTRSAESHSDCQVLLVHSSA